MLEGAMRKWVIFFLLLGVLAMNCGFLVTGYRRDIPAATLRAEYADAASRFLEVDGTVLHVKDQGPRAAAAAATPPLVLLHGTGASLHTWDGWIDALGDDFRLVRFDLPGFGLTGPNPEHDYRITRYVATLDALLDRLALARVDLAGNSLGGEIAWRYALAHPERVRRLVLIDAAGYPHSEGDGNVLSAGRVPVLRRLLRRVTPRFLVEEGLRQVYADDAKITPALIERHHRLLLREGNRDAMVARLNVPPEDRSAALPEIDQPTLVLWGAEDPWIPLEHGHRFARDLPRAELIVYDDLGHVPMEEDPARTAADVRAFLLAADPARAAADPAPNLSPPTVSID